MNDILFEVLKAVSIIAIMIIVRYAVPYMKEQVSKSKYAHVVDLVSKAVMMAEQTIIGSKTGAEKKAIVVDFLKRMLCEKNISITDEQLDTLIEAAVFAMNKKV